MAMEVILKEDVDKLKAWVSKREDTYRLPYERNQVTRKRRAVLICSTNRLHYLDDEQNRQVLRHIGQSRRTGVSR